MIRDRKKPLIKRIRPQDIEYIEYHLWGKTDVGDNYCIIGNPVYIKLKSDKNDELHEK